MHTLELVEREASRPNGLTRFPLAAAHLESLVIDGLLLAQSHNYSDALARRTFGYSIFFLAMLFAGLMVDHYLPLAFR